MPSAKKLKEVLSAYHVFKANVIEYCNAQNISGMTESQIKYKIMMCFKNLSMTERKEYERLSDHLVEKAFAANKTA